MLKFNFFFFSIPQARQLLLEIILQNPNDGFALVHYGFILKTVDHDFKAAIDYFQKGFQTKDPGVIDGLFYFHLGDAYQRLGRHKDANKVNYFKFVKLF